MPKEAPSAYRPEFEAALRLFARISEAVVAAGAPRPVLVGGAAAELYSAGAISTGDFDVVTPAQDVFEDALRAHGFSRHPGLLGHVAGGWVHPDLRLGFEVVASSLLDGRADRTRLVLFNLHKDGRAAVLSVEDMIADRMGQYASGTAPAMRAQAARLFALHPDLDRAYLDRRIKEETLGDYGAGDLDG